MSVHGKMFAVTVLYGIIWYYMVLYYILYGILIFMHAVNTDFW